MNQLLVWALETPAITHAVVAGISTNGQKRFELRQPCAVRCYDPLADGLPAREEHAARTGD